MEDKNKKLSDNKDGLIKMVLQSGTKNLLRIPDLPMHYLRGNAALQ